MYFINLIISGLNKSNFISFIKFIIGGIYNGICSIIYWLLGYDSKFIVNKKNKVRVVYGLGKRLL